MTLLFFSQAALDTIAFIRELGFPIFVALGLLWFLHKVWQYVTRKLDSKDDLVKVMVEQHEKHREKMVETQQELVKTQSEIRNVLVAQTELIKAIHTEVEAR